VSTEKENPRIVEEKDSVKKPAGVDYMEDSHATVYRHVPQKAANALYLLAVIIVISFVWAFFAKLNVSTTANGKIVASSQVQEIQHLEGGIVKKVYVKEGDHVKKGQDLVLLDDTRFASEYQQGVTKVAVLQADIARLTAKAEGKEELVFDAAFEAANPVQAREAKEFFIHDKNAFDKNIALLNKQYSLLNKELNIMTPLAKQGVVSDVELLRLNRQLVSLQQGIEDKKNTESDQAREQLNKAQGDFSLSQEIGCFVQSFVRLQRALLIKCTSTPWARLLSQVRRS
jgi:adhesin transport system membrane fusion protein